MGAQVDLPTRQSGLTALALASAAGWVEGVEALLAGEFLFLLFLLSCKFSIHALCDAAKADPALLDHAHWNPLMHSCANGLFSKSVHVVRVLLGAAPATVHHRCRDTGLDALALAAGCGATDVVKLLVAGGATVSADSMALQMLLKHSSSYVACLEALLALPSCNLAAVTHDNTTPLLRACMMGQPALVELLLAHPASAMLINVANADGMLCMFIFRLAANAGLCVCVCVSYVSWQV